MDSRWSNIKAHDNGGAGIRFGGPHDSQWVNVTSFSNGSHGVHLPPHATGMLITNLHCWGSAYGVLALALLSEASAVSFVNCSMEGSDVTQVALLGVNSSWVGGRVFNPAGGGVFPSGIQIGCQAGQVPYPGMIYQAGGVTLAEGPTGIYIKTLIDDCTGANGAIWVANDGGNNVIDVLCRQTAGKVISSSGLNGSSSYHIKQNGLTPDGSQQLGGLYTFPVNAFSAVVISDAAGHDIMNVNTASRNVSYPNGTAMQGYSDNYSTLKYSLNATGNGEVKLGNSSSLYSGSGVPSSGLGTNGDFYFRTDTPGTANQRLYVKSSGTWSGIL